MDYLNQILLTLLMTQNLTLIYISIQPNGTVTLRQSETLTFTCSASSIPQASLSWTLGGNPLPATAPPVSNAPDVTSTLVYTADKQDNGKQLTCTGTRNETTISDNVKLNIQFRPVVSILPTFTPYEVIENTTNLRISCVVDEANPAVISYEWYQNDSPVLSESSSTLTLARVTKSSIGNYSCNAINSVGSSDRSENVLMDVLYGVTLFSINNKEVNESGGILVTCDGLSNPRITDNDVKWTKQNNNTFSHIGKTLNISNVNRLDIGTYICTVELTLQPSNGQSVKVTGSTAVQFDVFYRPSVAISPDHNPYLVIENSTNIQLTCTVTDANPNVTSYIWYKNNQQITSVNSTTYTITPVSRSDAGDYECVGINALGTSDKSSVKNVDILYGVYIQTLNNKAINETSTLSITCDGESNPPIDDNEVTWTKINDSTFKQTGKNLTLVNIKKEDDGTYICNITKTLLSSDRVSVQATGTAQVIVDVYFGAKPYPTNFLPDSLGVGEFGKTFLNITIYFISNPPPTITWIFQRNASGQNTTLANIQTYSIDKFLYVSQYQKQTIQKDDVGKYFIRCYNGFGEAFIHTYSIFKADRPEKPTHVATFCDVNVMFVSWRSNFNRGAIQTFYVVWTNLETNGVSRSDEAIIDPGLHSMVTFATSNIMSNTNYRIQVESSNLYGTTISDSAANCSTTKKINRPDIMSIEQSKLTFGAGVGTGFGICLLVSVITFVIFIKFQHTLRQSTDKTFYDKAKPETVQTVVYNELGEIRSRGDENRQDSDDYRGHYEELDTPMQHVSVDSVARSS